jgi:hypothetical protein
MPARMAYLATPAPLRAWLTCLWAALAVGKTPSPDQRPLATWLRVAEPHDVLVGRWGVSLQERLIPCSPWASPCVPQVNGLGITGTTFQRRAALHLLKHLRETLAACMRSPLHRRHSSDVAWKYPFKQRWSCCRGALGSCRPAWPG